MVSPNLLAGRAIPSWTASQSGEWLRARVVAAGLSEPYSTGSAWVLMHGVDGVVFAWMGPPGDTAGLALRSVGGVESAALAPEAPFNPAAYRPAIADSVVAGGVRIWFLTHPRTGWEAINFPGLTTAPCLSDQAEIRGTLRRVAAAADEQSYRGRLPASAGRFRIAPDGGISITQPAERHLIQVGERTLGRSLTLPGVTGPLLSGQDVFVYTETPPAETDSAKLAVSKMRLDQLARTATAAGGLDLSLLIQRGGRRDLAAGEVEDLRRIAIALNRDPFLGQPVE